MEIQVFNSSLFQYLASLSFVVSLVTKLRKNNMIYITKFPHYLMLGARRYDKHDRGEMRIMGYKMKKLSFTKKSIIFVKNVNNGYNSVKMFMVSRCCLLKNVNKVEEIGIANKFLEFHLSSQ